jgi:hypothetical protein
MAPDWLTIAMGPSSGSFSRYMVEKESTVPVPKLARPCVFGPISRIPALRAASRMRCSVALPSGVPISPKPEVMTIATRTPDSAHVSTASSAALPATAMIATSGVSCSASRSGYAATPCTSVRLGLIGYTRPV